MDFNSCLGKFKPYLDLDIDRDLAGEQPLLEAQKVVVHLVATRFQAHFLVIWKSTIDKPNKRFDNLEKLNDWFLANNGSADALVGIAQTSLQRVMAEGRPRPKGSASSNRALSACGSA